MKSERLSTSRFGLKDLCSFHILIGCLFLIIPMIPALNLRLPFSLRIGIFFIWLASVFFTVNRAVLRSWLQNLIARRAEIFWLLLFIFVMFVYFALVRSSEQGRLMIVHFLIMLLIILVDSFYSVIAPKFRMLILFLVILSFGVQAAISIPHFLSGFTLRQYLGFNREGLSNQEMLDMADKGIGGQYLYASLASVVFAAFALLEKVNWLGKILLYGSTILIIFSMALSSFLAPLALLVCGFLLLFFFLGFRSLKPKLIFGILIAILSFYWLYTGYLTDLPSFEHVTKKIEGFSSSIDNRGITTEADVTGRTSLVEVSINTFLDNALFGIGVPPLHSYHLIGEHMPWIDFLAYFGIIGSFPFFMFLWKIFSKNRKHYFAKGRGADIRNVLYAKLMLVAFVLFLLSNFISPMFTIPSSYIMVIFFYTSQDKTEKK